MFDANLIFGDLLPRGVFALLSAVIVLPRIRFEWAVAAYLLVVHVDISGGDFASASSLGLWNGWKAVVLPTALLMKASLRPLLHVGRQGMFWLWLALVAYAVISTGWSPFRLSGIKQIGFFYSYTALFLAFLHGHATLGPRMYRPFSWAVLGALALGVLQTYGFERADLAPSLQGRFSAFTAPQGFGLFLAVGLGIVLAYGRERIPKAVPASLLGVLLLVALWLNGSRAGFVGALLVFGFALLYRPLVRRSWAASVGLIAIFLLGSVASLVGGEIVRRASPETASALASQRSVELFGTLSGGELSIDDLSTMAWRLGMYQTMITRLAERSPQELVVGRGTSATGEIVSEGIYSYRSYDESTVDPNRLAHNELLRSMYEWGVIGTAILLSLVGLTLIKGLGVVRRTRSPHAHAMMGVVLLVTLYLFFENVFAAPGSPLGANLAFALALLAASGMRSDEDLAEDDSGSPNASGGSERPAPTRDPALGEPRQGG